MYTRSLVQNFKIAINSGRAVVLLGARRVGKTTLIKEFIHDKYRNSKVLELNCDLLTDRTKLAETQSVIEFAESYDVIFIDEAQKVENIGNILKILVDSFTKKKVVIVTGSSAINLQYKTSETLTGRKFIYNLYPFALGEVYRDFRELTIDNLKMFMVYGLYPEVITTKQQKIKEEILLELVNGYLYKDLLDWQLVRNSEVVLKLLQALALQIGSEVSYNELAQVVGIDKETVARYVELLEQSFVIFRLPPYYTNKRKVISKLRKVYFWDLGVRNAILNNFLPVDLRNDVGSLWENFAIVERVKYTNNKMDRYNRSFIRTYDQMEIDLIEEKDGKLSAYEMKWNSRRRRSAPSLINEIPDSEYKVITPENINTILQ